MTSDPWQLAKDLFHQTLEKPSEQRAAFLDQVCGGDPRLREKVAALVAAHDDADDFLASESAAGGEGPGDEIGPYKLLREIGAGGFGTVYLAEQSEPVRRKVALKIVKLGMDTKEIIARFEAERQALAMMNHPNIAQVHDAGATERGRPYFVMELVKGVPIVTYCDQAALGTSGRLELFIHVCQAIQHAHQKGIIHRDIKPSNVLVTMQDNEPVPKVIDFGIAKAMDHKLTEKTLLTAFEQMIGTPEYMSPEQAEMSELDVDTRADVYSLGVLLYELLTGTTPFDLKTVARQGYAEVMRVIRESDPPKPSTRISTLGEKLTDVARVRHTTPRLLGKLVRGDLDWIVMKALEKDRTRRYETANALAKDIGRFLAGEPVDAGPPSASYRVRKFVRRHRTAVGAAGIVLLALMTGLALATLGFMEARAQRDVAQEKEQNARTEALRSRTVVNLIDRAFSAVDPHQALGADYTVRQLLLAFDRDLGDSLADEPLVEATLRRTMGRAFRSLGLADDAERHMTRSFELFRRVLGARHTWTVDTLSLLGWVQHDQDKTDAALATFERVLHLRRELNHADHKIAATLNAMVDLYRHQGRYDEALAAGEEALALYRKPGADTRGAPTSLPSIYENVGRYADAEALYRELLSNFERVLGKGHPQSNRLLKGLAIVVRDKDEFAEAEKLAREALEVAEKYAGPESIAVASCLTVLGAILEHAMKFKQAETVLVQAEAHLRKRAHPDNVLRETLRSLGIVRLMRGRLDDAERNLEEYLQITIRLFGETGARTAQARTTLGRLYYNKRDFAKAEPLLRDGVERLVAAWGKDHRIVLSAKIDLGRVLYRTRRSPEAEKLLTGVVATLRTRYPDHRGTLASALNALAISIRNQGRTPVAELREDYEISRDVFGANHASTLTTQWSYGTALVATGKLDLAEKVLRAAYEGRKRVHGATHGLTVQTAHSLAHCLDRLEKHAEAEPIWRRLLELQRKYRPKGHVAIGDAYLMYGICLGYQGRHSEAEPLLAAGVKNYEKSLPKGHWATFRAMSLLGGSLAAQEKFEEAEPLLLKGYTGMKLSTSRPQHKREALDRIVQLYEAWGKAGKAAEWRAK